MDLRVAASTVTKGLQEPTGPVRGFNVRKNGKSSFAVTFGVPNYSLVSPDVLLYCSFDSDYRRVKKHPDRLPMCSLFFAHVYIAKSLSEDVDSAHARQNVTRNRLEYTVSHPLYIGAVKTLRRRVRPVLLGSHLLLFELSLPVV